MRDIAIIIFLVGAIPISFFRPAIGALFWVWVSVMSPHRLAYGFAYDLPIAQFIAIAMLLGLFLTNAPKRLPITPSTVTLILLVLWMNVTTVVAIDFSASLEMWEKVMKIQIMTIVVLMALHTRKHVHLLMWVLAGSVAFYGIKGGLFTLRGGGGERVYGPSGSFIEENNSLALAIIMTIPLLEYLRTTLSGTWQKRAMILAMALCGISALGSHSRGGLLAIAAMLLALWLKSQAKFKFLILVTPVAVAALTFMPDKWVERMETIQSYEEDSSAMGRINAWQMAINLAKDRPIVGGGFEIYTASVFARYAPNPGAVVAAHSIFFAMLGEHGYVGLTLFLLLWIFTWRDAAWVIKNAKATEELLWASKLAAMVQVSLVGYAVGGAFLSLAYYDVPYYLLVAITITRKLVESAISNRSIADGRSAHGAVGKRVEP